MLLDGLVLFATSMGIMHWTKTKINAFATFSHFEKLQIEAVCVDRRSCIQSTHVSLEEIHCIAVVSLRDMMFSKLSKKQNEKMNFFRMRR